MAQTWQSAGVEQDFINKANETMKSLLSEQAIPEQIKLSEFFESFIDYHKEIAFEEQWETPDVRIEESEMGRSKYIHIYFDQLPEEEYKIKKSNYQLDNYLAMRVIGQTDDGEDICEIYASKIDNDVIGKTIEKHYKKYEKLMIAMYYCSAKLIIDCDVNDIYYPNYCD